MRVTLKVIGGPHKGQVYTFAGHDTFLVGRSKRAHFRLPAKDRYFSRVHFLVEVNPPQCRLMDMNSRNGTFVNGQRVEMIDLKDKDQIRAGHTILRVHVEEPEPIPVSVLPPSAAEESVYAIPLPQEVPPFVPVVPVAQVSPPSVAPRLCRACEAPLTTALASGPPAQLCPACLTLIRDQEQFIDGYRLIRPLGQGSMGVVYLAVRDADDSLVALKTVMPAVAGTPAQVERFLREADILRQLQHPNIVAFRESGECGGKFYFAMDYVRGHDASRLLRSEGALPVARAAGLVCQLLEALDYAHGRGFVHRDIKPANLLLTTLEGREVVRLADFGLARVYQASQLSGLTMTGDIGGTVAFMAPEQITNYRDVKPPVDQYAAAATLYNLLTAQYVYDLPRELSRQIGLILDEDPVPIRKRRSDLPEALAAVIHRALARDPGDRYASARDFHTALARFAH
jgi:serine/threonine-protein kinase